jgi:hypothetical protein
LIEAARKVSDAPSAEHDGRRMAEEIKNGLH